MPAICPFCARENSAAAIVCGACSRDIAVPLSLIAERDDLLKKRAVVLAELSKARDELERLGLGKRNRSA
jgi:hypothetical protein